MKKTAAKLFVISAPSGSGKTTLCNKLLGEKKGLERSISTTTRKPRPGEKDGVDYFFVSDKRFKRMVDSGDFLEHEENFGNFYGTPKNAIKENLKRGRSVVLSIDVKGAMKVRKEFPKKSVLIFILPPSMKVLSKRLRSRMSDHPKMILKRLSLAKKEMAYKKKYDYRIINDRLDSAYKKLKKIITLELGGA
ncbi:MAG: guanylate kinase [Candidatus Omnitrophica bacterium]|nr:guanylate kinase [Candidatus Omnitrophota bacterium]